MRRFLLAALLLSACNRSVSREPVRIGSKSDDRSTAIAESVARRLERAGCVVERHLRLGDSVTLDRALEGAVIDAYVESHSAALTQILRRKTQPGPEAEAEVRIAYVKKNLVWAPPVGSRDDAVVFRKSVDERCRSASRTFMATGSMLQETR
ncbi:MAG: glycine betaine ABC transporter substrate-binding protein [Acidobacteriota bacterium]